MELRNIYVLQGQLRETHTFHTHAQETQPAGTQPAGDGVAAASQRELAAVMAHVMRLFDVATWGGVLPRMNSVYTKLGETHNVMRTLRDVLGLGESGREGWGWVSQGGRGGAWGRPGGGGGAWLMKGVGLGEAGRGGG